MQPQQLIPVLSLRWLTAVTSAAALQRPLRPAAATSTSATPRSKKMKLIQKHTVSSQSHRLRLRDQIKAYIRCEPEGEDDDPLSYWRSNSSKFPLLQESCSSGNLLELAQELARDTLSQSASSVPVERHMSVRPSVTLVDCAQIRKAINVWSLPYDSPILLVLKALI